MTKANVFFKFEKEDKKFFDCIVEIDEIFNLSYKGTKNNTSRTEDKVEQNVTLGHFRYE